MLFYYMYLQLGSRIYVTRIITYMHAHASIEMIQRGHRSCMVYSADLLLQGAKWCISQYYTAQEKVTIKNKFTVFD